MSYNCISRALNRFVDFFSSKSTAAPDASSSAVTAVSSRVLKQEEALDDSVCSTEEPVVSTYFSSTSSATSAVSNPFLRIEDSHLDNIMRFVGEPTLTSSVCRAFRASTQMSGVYKDVLLSWIKEARDYAVLIENIIREHPEQFPGIPPSLTLDNCAALTNTQCETIVKRVERKIRELKDKKLILFFARISVSIPLLKAVAVSVAEMRIQNAATALRTWMNENEEILNKITHLDLSHAKFTTLPLEITLFKNLRNLDLSDNRFDAVPDVIAQLENLVVLNLGSNLIETLPDSLMRLQKLRNLDLSDNRLTAVGPIPLLESLRELNLDYNDFDNEDEIIAQFGYLEKVSVEKSSGFEELEARFRALRE